MKEEDGKKIFDENIEKDLKNSDKYGIIDNRGMASGKVGYTDGHTTITGKKAFDFNDYAAIEKEIDSFAKEFAYAEVEHALVISPDGNAYSLIGTKSKVNTELVGEKALKGCICIHNHPIEPGNDRADSFSLDDVYTSNKYLQGRQYLVSGTRRDAFEFTEYYITDKMENNWDKAKFDARNKHWNDGTIIEFLQQDTLRELNKYYKGFKYYENI